MTIQHTRRDILRGTLAAAGLGMLGIPEWALPALAQGETLVPFTDAPPTFPAPGPVNRQYDVRTIDGPFTPADRFFTTQHYGHPDVDAATYRLKVSGLVNKPLSLSLDELKRIAATELIFGFECSGNRRPLQGLCGNGRWTGAALPDAARRGHRRRNQVDGSGHHPDAGEIVSGPGHPHGGRLSRARRRVARRNAVAVG